MAACPALPIDDPAPAVFSDRPRRRAPVVVVTGARGGAGATSFAVALVLAAARDGRQCLLIDADAVGGGIDLALGMEDQPGDRWTDLRSSDVGVLGLAGLPRLTMRGEVCVLSCDRAGPSAEHVAAGLPGVLDAGVAAHDLVVVDLPRSAYGELGWVAHRADLLLLVVPAELRACAAAVRQVSTLGCRTVRLVVRGPAPGGLDAATMAGATQVPLAVELAAEPHLAADLERGDPPGGRRRGPLARGCRQVLRELDRLALPSG